MAPDPGGNLPMKNKVPKKVQIKILKVFARYKVQ